MVALMKPDNQIVDTIIQGDCLEMLRTLDTCSVDAIVTDPPAGIGFMMSKDRTWDSDKGGRDAWIAWLSQIMAGCLRVLKPGGHALIWALPRTSHWTATAIEDAGFEIRDIVTHVFGSGFPKSMDISKAIDKMQGAEREVIGEKRTPDGLLHSARQGERSGKSGGIKGKSVTPSPMSSYITAPATPEASQFQGYGTALKPSVEMWLHAQKPFTPLGYCDIINQQLQQLEADLCVLHAKLAEKNLTSTLANSNGVKAVSAQDCALIQQEAKQKKLTAIGEVEDLQLTMDMSGYESVMTTCLNIVTSWSNIWGDLSKQMSTFTIEMVTSLITDLKTLNSLLSKLTPNIIIQAVMSPDGQKSLVQGVVSLLDALQVRCNAILTLSAIENATEIVPSNNLSANTHPQNVNETIKAYSSRPASEHWILARKPISEKSIAENVLRWGTGGLAIDQCRVGTHDYTQEQWNKKGEARTTGNAYGVHKGSITPLPQGRFPSNLLLSHSLFCTPLGTRKVKGNGTNSPIASIRKNGAMLEGMATHGAVNYNDSEGMEEVQAWECHKGGIVTLPSYEYGNAVLSPLSELSYLLDQLQSLLEVLHNCSKNDNIRLNSEDAAAHIVCISQVDFSDGLAHDLDDAENHLHELAHALGMSQFVGSLFDCPSCLRLCGEYAHRLVTAFQDGLPSLADALSHVYHCLVEHVHSQHYQERVQPNGDDFQHVDTLADKQRNKTSVSQHSSGKSETLSHMQGTLFESLQPVALHDNSQENKTSDSDRRETLCHNNCKSELVRLLAFLSFDLLSHVLPIDIIQQKAIDINTSPCPIRLLDEQSGIRKSGANKPHINKTNAPSGFNKNTSRIVTSSNPASEGYASRYFTQFCYTAKASKRERGENNTHPTVKSLSLMSWLCRLITPPGGTVLDCFAGSGSTCVAAIHERLHFIAIEQDASYCEIARARVAHAFVEVAP